MKKILACIDGSLYGQTCTQYALWFAHRTGAQVDALYVSELWQYEAPLVADFGGSLGAQPYMGLTAQLRQIENEKAAALRGYILSAFEREGLRGRAAFHHLSGSLVDCLADFESGNTEAETPHSGMLVIGKRGEAANMAKAHLGSNMERVVRSASLPCFVANREFFEPRKILLAFDGSASANKALAWYGANRAAFDGVELHAVTVVTKQSDSAQAVANLTIAEKALEGFGCKAICKTLEGIPADAISAYQQESGANLLLMGAYGHSRIRRLLIGSTTVELLQRCRVPVVLFR